MKYKTVTAEFISVSKDKFRAADHDNSFRHVVIKVDDEERDLLIGASGDLKKIREKTEAGKTVEQKVGIYKGKPQEAKHKDGTIIVAECGFLPPK